MLVHSVKIALKISKLSEMLFVAMSYKGISEKEAYAFKKQHEQIFPQLSALNLSDITLSCGGVIVEHTPVLIEISYPRLSKVGDIKAVLIPSVHE